VYDNPNVAALRDAERSRQVEAKRLEGLRTRQTREWDALVSSRESEKLRHDQTVERDHHSQYASQPAGLAEKHKAAREKLDARHTHEQEKLKRRHANEIAAAKHMPPEAKIHA
jgi:hypothetical protein